MADIQIKDVTTLEQVDRIKDGDTLLVVRQNEDGTQSCYRTDGMQFKGDDGEDAYSVAKKQGFTGSYSEWVAQVAKASSVGISYDGATGEIVINN